MRRGKAHRLLRVLLLLGEDLVETGENLGRLLRVDVVVLLGDILLEALNGVTKQLHRISRARGFLWLRSALRALWGSAQKTGKLRRNLLLLIGHHH